jgi:hypothetical protein
VDGKIEEVDQKVDRFEQGARHEEFHQTSANKATSGWRMISSLQTSRLGNF